MTWTRRLLVSSAVKAGNFRGREGQPCSRGPVPGNSVDIGVVGAAIQATSLRALEEGIQPAKNQLKLPGREFGVQQWNGANSWTVISGLPTNRRRDVMRFA
jgi:hypothetical protein